MVALAVMATAAPRAEAASLRIGTPALVAPGWTRVAGRYENAGAEPAFRALARCAQGGAHVLDGVVHVASAQGAVWVDLPGTPDRLVPATNACETPEVSIEMLVDEAVIASAPVSQPGGPPDLLTVPPSPARPARRFSIKGAKYGAPLTKRTEAGVEWALDSRLSIQLNYERTAQAPMMPFDHDDGILTRFRIGF